SPTAASDYSGGTLLLQGALVIGSPNSALGTGPLTLVGGALQTNVAGGVTLANPVVLNVGGVTTTNPYAFTTAEFTLGSVDPTLPPPLTLSGAVSLNGVSTLRMNAVATFSGPVSGSGALVKAGTEPLTLSGNNTHSGATVLAAGTLTVN